MSTISIIDTIIQPANSPEKRRTYRNHSTEFRRAVVELTLVDGASVSLIAREQDIRVNAMCCKYEGVTIGEPIVTKNQGQSTGYLANWGVSGFSLSIASTTNGAFP